MAQFTYGQPSDQISDLKEKATGQFSMAADQAQGMANRVAEQGRHKRVSGSRRSPEIPRARSIRHCETSQWRRS
jgi:hypothetical protein